MYHICRFWNLPAYICLFKHYNFNFLMGYLMFIFEREIKWTCRLSSQEEGNMEQTSKLSLLMVYSFRQRPPIVCTISPVYGRGRAFPFEPHQLVSCRMGINHNWT